MTGDPSPRQRNAAGVLMPAAEHLQWAKDRALAHVEAGDATNAFASMVSDLGKHPETADHAGIELGMMLAAGGHLDTLPAMREFIEGLH